MSDYWVVLFPNNTAAMRAARILKDAGVRGCRLVPVPGELSRRCGVALRLEGDAVTPALTAIHSGRVPVSAVHRLGV